MIDCIWILCICFLLVFLKYFGVVFIIGYLLGLGRLLIVFGIEIFVVEGVLFVLFVMVFVISLIVDIEFEEILVK